MSAAAPELWDTFRPASLNLSRTRALRLAGVLEAPNGLEEIAVIGDSAVSPDSIAVRAFRVHGGVERLGLQMGDCLLVQPKRQPEPGDLVVIDLDGVVFARRIANGLGTRLHFEPPLPKRSTEPKVIGSFAGILRKRLAGKRVGPTQRPLFRQAMVGSRSASLIRLLRGKLGMVESTCAATANPRLRRALRNEAENLRRQLQNEAGDD